MTDLFAQYHATPTIEIRNQIAMENYGIVRKIARQVAGRYTYVHVDDLEAEGFFGLIDAVTHYCADRGLFSSYAWLAVRNRIMRYVRKQSKHTAILSERVQDTADASPSAHAIVEANEIESFIINAYKPTERIVMQRLLEGQSMRQACTVDAVSMSCGRRMRRIARAKMARMGVGG